MSRRTISDKTRAWLSGEIEVWQSHNLLSSEQRARILELYESPGETADRKRSLALLTLMGLAALMIGLAALLLVGYNWQAMPNPAKLLILFGSLIAAHGTAFYLRYRPGARLLSEAGFLLGCLLYGVGIWQIAQIFHIQSHYPNGIWLWAMGSLLFALCLDTPLLHVLFVALAAIWAGTEILGFHSLDHTFFWSWHRIPGGAYSLPLLVLPGLVWAYRKRSAVTVALYAPLVAWWAMLQPFAWEHEEVAIYLVGAVGALFLIAAEFHRKGSPLAKPFRLYGVLLTAGALALLSFHDFNEEMLRGFFYHDHDVATANLSVGIIIALLTAAAIAVAAWLHHTRINGAIATPVSKNTFVQDQWFPLLVLAAMAALPLLNAVALGFSQPDAAELASTIVANVGMLVLATWLLRTGLSEDRGLPFAAGVVYFLLWTIFRYIDLFDNFGGMLGAALMFLLCGAALLGMAIYWRHRKEIQHV